MGYVTKEGLFFEKWMKEHEYEYDDIPIEELLKAYADQEHQRRLEEELMDFLKKHDKSLRESEIIEYVNEYMEKKTNQ